MYQLIRYLLRLHMFYFEVGKRTKLQSKHVVKNMPNSFESNFRLSQIRAYLVQCFYTCSWIYFLVDLQLSCPFSLTTWWLVSISTNKKETWLQTNTREKQHIHCLWQISWSHRWTEMCRTQTWSQCISEID